MVTGHGAGMVMCWRNNVSWTFGQRQDPREFMTVKSGVYVLAVPDFSHYARQYSKETEGGDPSESGSMSTYGTGQLFKKTVMKLSGNVQWTMGLMFERDKDEGGRSFEFIPHYKVITKHPDYVKHTADGKVSTLNILLHYLKLTDLKPWDAYRGFRSNHIHMSIAIAAPVNRDWSVTNTKPDANYNSVHLTPRFFTHFFNWWSQFSGIMSLPIRQGKLWPGPAKSNKKFGRHLATIKYQVLLSPLYMSHIYKHKDAEDYSSGVVSSTGLKIRLDSFMVDLHQRREEFTNNVKGDNKQTTTSAMRFNQAQLDFIHADVRAVSSSIGGTNKDDLDEATEDVVASYQESAPSVDLSRFTIPDNDLGWIDMDDFVELDWILPSESNPDTKILPLAFAPRFTYFRQTDHGDNISGDTMRSSRFGSEDTHFCVMSERNDPRRVQCDLILDRLAKVREQSKQNERALGEQELKIVRDTSGGAATKQRLEVLQEHSETLKKKQEALQNMYDTLLARLDAGDRRAVPDPDRVTDQFFKGPSVHDPTDAEVAHLDTSPLADYMSDFNNRFIAHNPQVKWNNSLRNIILRYVHQVSQRRGFVYYMSRRAVKFILDIVDEQKKTKEKDVEQLNSATMPSTNPLSPMEDDELDINDRIKQLLDDGKKFVDANDPQTAEAEKPSADNVEKDIGHEFTPQNTYHVRLIAPQVQLQSDKNPKAASLITAKGMQLKVIQIMDKDRVSDDVSGLVQRRFTAAMDSLQIFVTSTKTFSTEYLELYSANSYGAPQGSCWPPWVPYEAMFEFNMNPYGFQRVVHRTSASLRYDKYNTLRLKYNDDVTGGDGSNPNAAESSDNRIDHLYVDFPHLRAICDSNQYYAMYIIVLDLLLYSEPLEKHRSERLEKIMLASDFSDLDGVPEMVIMLQERIRQLEEIKMHFQINEKFLDRQGWKDRIQMEADLNTHEDELFFMMKAITTAQKKNNEDRAPGSQTNGLLRYYIAASQIVWHLIRDGQESLAEFQLTNAVYDRTDNNDGSNHHAVEIGSVQGLNLLPNALYPEMIAPYFDKSANAPSMDGKNLKMLRVRWYKLEAVAGIEVLDHFEVDMFPVRIQLEREVGKKLIEYVFPGVNTKDGKDARSPFMVKNMLPEADEEDVEGTPLAVAAKRPNTSPKIDEQLEKDIADGAGTLEHRLQPTLTLPDRRRADKPSSRHKFLTHEGRSSSSHHLSLFNKSGERPSVELRRNIHSARALASSDTLTPGNSRPQSHRTTSNTSTANSNSDATTKRFGLHRSSSGNKLDSQKRSDDLTEMMSRASNFMTLSYVKIPTVVLCLSYKGKGQRNFEDVHDLVFRLPTLEYRNKTWSNYDLVQQVKKDVVRALIHHTGAIIGNKFSHRRPGKEQVGRLRQIANNSTMLSTPSMSATNTPKESQSREWSPAGQRNGNRSQTSFNSAGHSPSIRSFASQSADSQHSESGIRTGTASTQSDDTGRPRTASTMGNSMTLSTSGLAGANGNGSIHGLGIAVEAPTPTEDEHSRNDPYSSLKRRLTTISSKSGHGNDMSILGGGMGAAAAPPVRRPTTASSSLGMGDDDDATSSNAGSASSTFRRKSKMLLGKSVFKGLGRHGESHSDH